MRSLRPARPLNSIIREASYEASLATARGKGIARIHDLEEMIDWALARDPERFYQRENNFYIWKTEKISDQIPQVVVAYEYRADESNVYLIDIQIL